MEFLSIHILLTPVWLVFILQYFSSRLLQVYWMKKSVFFSVIASKSLKSSLFDICRTRLELKGWSPYIKDATVDSGGGGGAMEFSKNYISTLQN